MIRCTYPPQCPCQTMKSRVIWWILADLPSFVMMVEGDCHLSLVFASLVLNRCLGWCHLILFLCYIWGLHLSCRYQYHWLHLSDRMLPMLCVYIEFIAGDISRHIAPPFWSCPVLILYSRLRSEVGKFSTSWVQHVNFNYQTGNWDSKTTAQFYLLISIVESENISNFFLSLFLLHTWKPQFVQNKSTQLTTHRCTHT